MDSKKKTKAKKSKAPVTPQTVPETASKPVVEPVKPTYAQAVVAPKPVTEPTIVVASTQEAIPTETPKLSKTDPKVSDKPPRGKGGDGGKGKGGRGKGKGKDSNGSVTVVKSKGGAETSWTNPGKGTTDRKGGKGSKTSAPEGVATGTSFSTRTPQGQIVYPTGQVPWRVRAKLDVAMLDSNADATLEKDFPGVYLAREPTKGANAHGVLHYCRVFMEQDVFHHLQTTEAKVVLDVGGMSSRAGKVAEKLGIKYHACCPIMDTSDLGRKPYRTKNSCDHKAQDCNCLAEVDEVMAIHSLYYLSPTEWATLILKTNKKAGQAVVHHFPSDERGTFPPGAKTPEAHYQRLEEGLVKMVVEGNNHSYQHSALDWLSTDTAIDVVVNDRLFVMGWTLKREVRGTRWYSFVVAEESRLPHALPYALADKVEISDTVLSMMSLRSYKMEGGFLNLIPKQGEPRKIYIPLLRQLILMNAGKFPSPSVYTQLNNTGRRLSLDNAVVPKEIRDAEWYGASLVHTVTLAYLQTTIDLNNAQRGLEDYQDLLERVGYMLPVMRERFGNTIFGRLLNQIERACVYLGLEVPYRYMEDVAVVHSQHASPMVKSTGRLLRAVIPFSFGVAVGATSLAVKTTMKVVGFIAPSLAAMGASLGGHAARRVFNHIPFVRYCCDPALVQAECDRVRILYEQETAKTDIVLKNNEFSPLQVKQDIKHKGCFKVCNPVVIQPNIPCVGPTPFVVTEYAGLSNAPSTKSDANKMSALLHRLLSGVEHSSWEQMTWQTKVLTFMREAEILPNVQFISHWKDTHPYKTPREWLTEDYGRRNDAVMLAKLTRAVVQVESGEDCRFDVEWFVKNENAPSKWDANKCRGIFDPSARWKVSVAPDTHLVSKLMWAWFSPLSHDYRAKKQNIRVASGTTAPEMGAWLKSTVDYLGTGFFIMEIDVSAFEANQTWEQNADSFGEMKRLGMREEAYQLYLQSNNLLFVDKPRAPLDSLANSTVSKRTMSKVVASRHGGNPSGCPDVTFRNTFNTSVSTTGLLMHLGVPKEDIVVLCALFLGDDNFSAIPIKYRKLFTRQAILDYYKRFHNWDVKVKLWDFAELPKAEFCSCYFIENEDGTYNFSPKLGRVLSKTFFLSASVANKPNTMLGIIRGLGHFKTGYMFSRVMAMLERKCVTYGAVSEVELHVDWSNNPLLHTKAVALADEYTIESDCVRYGLTKQEIVAVLQFINEQINKSDFPRAAVFLPSHPLFDVVCYVDLPIDYDDVNSTRIDEGLPSRHMVRTIYEWSYYEMEKGSKSIFRRLRETAALLAFPGRWDDGRSLRGQLA